MRAVLLRVVAVLPAIDRRCWRCCRWSRAACTAAAPAPSRCCSPAWAPARSSRRCSCRACAHSMSRDRWCAGARCCRRCRRLVGGARAERLGRRAGDGGRRRGLDRGRQLADGGGAARAARLGARARHVDLPDGADGRQRRSARRCGARWRRWTDVRTSLLLSALGRRRVPCCWRRAAFRSETRRGRRPHAGAPSCGPAAPTIESTRTTARCWSRSSTASIRRARREFREVMQETRRSRLRHGALAWGLFHDVSRAGPLHRVLRRRILGRAPAPLRPHDGVDVALRERRLAFHHRRAAAGGVAATSRPMRAEGSDRGRSLRRWLRTAAPRVWSSPVRSV